MSLFSAASDLVSEAIAALLAAYAVVNGVASPFQPRPHMFMR